MSSSQTWSGSPSRHAGRAAVVTAGVIALLLSGCSGESGGSGDKTATAASSAACAPGGTLVLARDQDPTTSFDPVKATGNGNLFTLVQIYDRLVEQMPGKSDPEPGLAEKWSVSDDGKEYTFNLRAAKFSDGSPVTAKDVVFSIKRTIDGEESPNFSFLYSSIATVEAVDDSTVKITTKAVDASILSALTLPVASVVSEAAFTKLGQEAFAKTPVGSGAFMVESFTPAQTVKFKKNPNYWRTGKPALDGLEMPFLEDENARMLKVQSGEAQVAQGVPPLRAKEIDALPNVGVLNSKYMVAYAVYLNNAAKPLDDKNVRQALNYATPKDVINQAVLGGYGTIQNSMIAPNLRFWDDSVQPYAFDVEKAKQLMAASSAPQGFELPILVDAGDQQQQQTAEILKDAWSKIGVTVKIEPMDSSATFDKFAKGDYMGKLFAPSGISSDTPDDSEQASIFLDGSNGAWNSFFTKYNNPKATQLVKDAVATLDPAARGAKYSELQKLAMEDAPFVPMLNSPTLTAVSDKVQGLQTLPTGWWRLEDVCLKK